MLAGYQVAHLPGAAQFSGPTAPRNGTRAKKFPKSVSEKSAPEAADDPPRKERSGAGPVYMFFSLSSVIRLRMLLLFTEAFSIGLCCVSIANAATWGSATIVVPFPPVS